MADKKSISEAIEKAVSDAVGNRLAELREALTAEVVAKVTQTIEPLLANSDAGRPQQHSAPATRPTDLLNAAIASVYDSNAQGEVLRVMLDGVAQFTSRAALFVVKGGNLSAWQSRGFENEAAFKKFSLSSSAGLAGRAVHDKEPVSAAAVEFDSSFISTHGNPKDGNATVFPIVVRDKAAAVLYADAGTSEEGVSDQSAVRILVRATASWLEIIGLRKTAAGDAPMAEIPPPAATHAPEPEHVDEVAQQKSESPATEAVHAEVDKPSASAPPADLSGLSAEDQEIHKKAKRFAKLLVDEIKLYNQAKVAEGRHNKDLYSRLKDDIDKSRATYEKRYGSTAAASGRYFHAEVVRILAENDPSVLGSDFS